MIEIVEKWKQCYQMLSSSDFQELPIDDLLKEAIEELSIQVKEVERLRAALDLIAYKAVKPCAEKETGR